MHAADINTLRGPIGCICARAHALNSEPSIATATCTSAEQAQIEPVRDGVARRGAGLAGRARWAVEGGAPRKRRSASYAPNSSTLHHLALGTSTCNTSVPTVIADVGVGKQLHETYLRSPLAEVYIPLRRLEMKMPGRERYTQLRKRGQRALSPICRLSHEDRTPADARQLVSTSGFLLSRRCRCLCFASGSEESPVGVCSGAEPSVASFHVVVEDIHQKNERISCGSGSAP